MIMLLIMVTKHKTIETKIAEELAIPYLSKATEAGANEVAQMCTGYIHGSKRRAISMGVMITRPQAWWPLSDHDDQQCLVRDKFTSLTVFGSCWLLLINQISIETVICTLS